MVDVFPNEGGAVEDPKDGATVDGFSSFVEVVDVFPNTKGAEAPACVEPEADAPPDAPVDPNNVLC